LNRGRSGITLTRNGERVLRYIREILKWNNEMTQEIADINGLKIGTVRIGTFSSVSVQWLPEILKEFSKYYPLINIKMIDVDYDVNKKWIAKREVDFGFLPIPTSL